MKTLRILLALLILFAGFGIWFVASGRYDVAADQSPAKWEEALFGAIKDRSVAHRASQIAVPDLGGAAQLQMGYEAFRVHCVTCHGAPGLAPDPMAMGLHPMPPGLDFPRVQDASDAELFWIVKNGLKHTGMPSFSMSLSEEQIWGVVAFLRRLPQLDPDQFGRFGSATP